MTFEDFCRAVREYRRKYKARVRSWGRTDQDSINLKGFAGDPHTWDLAVDVTYGSVPNRPGSALHPKLPHSCAVCSELGLKVIHELDHDHLQPSDFPMGPVTDYAGERKTWV